MKRLAGKTLDEQVKVVLKNRLHDLNDQISKENDERQRLERAIGLTSETNRFNQPGTNAQIQLPRSGAAF
jgi:hypothetical protein